MFLFQENEADYTWPVTLYSRDPGQPGEWQESSYQAKFSARYTLEDLLALKDRKTRDLVSEVLVGWSEILDGDQKTVPFTEENKALLLRNEIFVSQTFAAYVASRQGPSIEERRAKNLKRPSGDSLGDPAVRKQTGTVSMTSTPSGSIPN